MSDNPKILVATEVLADAELVRRLLSDEFESIRISVDPARAVTDFESFRPDVLVLAFNDMEKAERYYLGLYRLGRDVHLHPHRTVILCNKDELRRIYELCKKEYFDDYILFWPMTHDVSRLPMAIHHAMRQLRAAQTGAPPQASFAAQVKRIAQLETKLRKFAEGGERQLNAATATLRSSKKEIETAIDDFSHRMAAGDLNAFVQVLDEAGLLREVGELVQERIAPRLNAGAEAVAPVRNWLGTMQNQLAPELQSARMLGEAARQVRPLVLVVDDDELQLRAMSLALPAGEYDVATATSGAEALGVLRRRRPDLILMDVGLPDIDGIEVTKRIKAVEAFATIPVIMVTGHSEKHLVVNSLGAGAVDFVVKPFDRSTLLLKIAKLLGE